MIEQVSSLQAVRSIRHRCKIKDAICSTYRITFPPLTSALFHVDSRDFNVARSDFILFYFYKQLHSYSSSAFFRFTPSLIPKQRLFSLIPWIASSLIKMSTSTATLEPRSEEKGPSPSHSLAASHGEKHNDYGDVVRDTIIGFADGLTVPFALTAGLSS